MPLFSVPQRRVSPGMHTPSSAHCVGNIHSPVSELQRGSRSPQRPQLSGLGRGATHTCIVQLSAQRQFVPQTCSPLEPHGCAEPGAHWPSPVHVDQFARPVFGSQVLVCVPQLPHVRVAGSAHTWSVQALRHWQLSPQGCVPDEPQPRAASGAHTPSSSHGPQPPYWPVLASHVRRCKPQLPHARDDSPVQVWPAHVDSQRQLSPHSCVPDEPQLRTLFARHSPWSVHSDQSDHCPDAPSQLRVSTPQLPQLCRFEPKQLCPVHASSQLQLPSHTCVPPRPQPRVSSGSQTPSPAHGDQSDQLPLVISQVRVRVPQLPHAIERSPSHS
jgi:hypothetical protein